MRLVKLLSLTALLLQVGCQHLDQNDNDDELFDDNNPKGAGLFSGEKGYFDLTPYKERGEGKPLIEQSQEPKTEQPQQ